MLTRSRSAAQARFERRYQAGQEKFTKESIDAFNSGINAILHQWTALELAVYHRWGGPASEEQVEALQYELFELFLSPDKVYKDDVALVLEDYLETYFNTVCEDGSPDEIGELLCILWAECIAKNYGRVNMLIERLAQRRRDEVLQQSQGLAKGDEADSDDDDDMDSDPHRSEALIQEALAESGALQAIAEDDNEVKEDSPPLVDADGFQTVVGNKKGKKGSNKGHKTAAQPFAAAFPAPGFPDAGTGMPVNIPTSKNKKKAAAIAAAAALAMSLAEDGIIGHPGATEPTTVFTGLQSAADGSMDDT